MSGTRVNRFATTPMASLGLHFRLHPDQANALRAVDEDARVSFAEEEFEEKLWRADKSLGQETDQAWDAIHRSLTDGMLGWDNGSYPLNHAIFGGESLYDGGDYFLSLKSPEEVRDVAVALRSLTKATLRAGYDRIDPGDYGMPLGESDFEYAWDWFQGVVEFYQRAAAAGQFVLFTVDQ